MLTSSNIRLGNSDFHTSTSGKHKKIVRFKNISSLDGIITTTQLRKNRNVKDEVWGVPRELFRFFSLPQIQPFPFVLHSVLVSLSAAIAQGWNRSVLDKIITFFLDLFNIQADSRRRGRCVGKKKPYPWNPSLSQALGRYRAGENWWGKNKKGRMKPRGVSKTQTRAGQGAVRLIYTNHIVWNTFADIMNQQQLKAHSAAKGEKGRNWID